MFRFSAATGGNGKIFVVGFTHDEVAELLHGELLTTIVPASERFEAGPVEMVFYSGITEEAMRTDLERLGITPEPLDPIP